MPSTRVSPLIGLFEGALLVIGLALPGWTVAAPEARVSTGTEPTSNVQVSLVVTGELREASPIPAAGNGKDIAGTKAKTQQAKEPPTPAPGPISVKAKGFLHYQEKRLPLAAQARNASSGPLALSTLRHYAKAQAHIQVGQEVERPELDEANSLVVCDGHAPLIRLKPLAEPMSRRQYDLLDVPLPTPYVQLLLPAAEKLPERWTHSDDLVGRLFRLDSVVENHLASAPVKESERAVVIKLEGRLSGRADGAKATIQVAGEYWLDRPTGRIVWLACKITEDREPGHASPGMRVVAEVKIKCESVPDPADWSGHAWPAAMTLATRAIEDPVSLQWVSERHGLRTRHDARWHAVVERSDGTILRLVDDGDWVAQCHLAALPDLPAGQFTKLAEFQQDIRKVLDQQFGEFTEAVELPLPDGRRQLRVVVQGTASDVPIRWIYYHLSNAEGRRATCVFTMAEEAVSHFADADRTLADSLQFLPKATASEPSAPAEKPTLPPQAVRPGGKKAENRRR